jgi:hypothetical protein
MGILLPGAGTAAHLSSVDCLSGSKARAIVNFIHSLSSGMSLPVRAGEGFS